jgi:hypothetical protein
VSGPDEIHLLGWTDGPIASLEITWRRGPNGGAEVAPSWGQQIAEVAMLITTGKLKVPHKPKEFWAQYDALYLAGESDV